MNVIIGYTVGGALSMTSSSAKAGPRRSVVRRTVRLRPLEDPLAVGPPVRERSRRFTDSKPDQARLLRLTRDPRCCRQLLR